MADIREVAYEAGVSAATVSRVINNSGYVALKTREKVKNAIEILNYRPNLLGRNLRRAETRLILVLLPTIANPFYSQVVKGMEDVAHKNCYSILLCNTDSENARELMYIELLRNRLADGVIFMAPVIKSEELGKIGKMYPAVQCSEYHEGTGIESVTIDNYKAAVELVRHLVSLGHRRIAMISVKNDFPSTKFRFRGYCDAISEAGIGYDNEYVVYGNYGFKSGFIAAQQLLELPSHPTAIFAISDMMAIGAIKAIRKHMMRVPEDIAVAGFDDIIIATAFEPELTTISQPKYEIGCAAMEILLDKISEGRIKSENRHKAGWKQNEVFMEYKLIKRGSTVKKGGE